MSVMDVVELASVLARRYYGPKSGAVVYALQQNPRSTVAELVGPASDALLAQHRRMLSVSDAAAPPPPLSREDVCRSLAALIQGGVVLVVGTAAPAEGGDGGTAAGRPSGAAGTSGGAAKRRRAGDGGDSTPPPLTHRYVVDTAPLILRLRHPFYSRLTQDQVSVPAGAMMGCLLARGRATSASLVATVVAAGEVADAKEAEEALAALLLHKYMRVVDVGFGGRPPVAGGGAGALAGAPGGGFGGGFGGGGGGGGGGSPGSSAGGSAGGSAGSDGSPTPSATNDVTVWTADMGHMQRLLLEDLCAFVAWSRLGVDASRVVRAAMRRTLRYPPSRDGSGATPSVPVSDVVAAVKETVPPQTALSLLSAMARPEHRYVDLGTSGVGEGGGGAGPSVGRTVAVRYGVMVRAVQAATVEYYVKKRWGTPAHRVYRLLTSAGVGSLELKDIGDAVLLQQAHTRELLYRLLLAGLVRVTEVAKSTEHKASAAYHLWSADGTEGVARVLGASVKAATNYLLRVEVLERCLDRVRREVHDDDSAASAEVEALQRRIDALDVTLLRLDKEIMVLRDLGDETGTL
ncbi:hypothetical protein I4F81_009226 [Pyropia yezoensis]|uniref:Uncharacterized protein n=1 Tax=Pyropia yezoensis TaxID=2788 RepID=A0ACC3C9B4_PYRYE|nr:hypothetical protein I4F81_009226 [Neopyropia yezoensis]